MRNIKSRFGLNYSQRNGAFLLILILSATEFGITLWSQLSPESRTSQNASFVQLQGWKEEIDSLRSSQNKKPRAIESFNPNSLEIDDWINLGFSQKQSQVILNYKKRLGGSFQSKKQIQECYIIDDEKYFELEPYILLPIKAKDTRKIPRKSVEPQTNLLKKFNPNDYSLKDWENIGFSTKQAQTILKYKKSLGGEFKTKQEISKCFVIDTETFQKLEQFMLLPSTTQKTRKESRKKEKFQQKETHSQKFYPNRNSLEDWMNLGFSEKQAQTILNYKKSLGGTFKTKEEIQKCHVINPQKFQEIEPLILFSKRAEKQTELRLADKKNLNKATAQDIFPYVSSKKVAYTLVKYRNSIGGFKTKAQILKVYGIQPEEAEKILQDFELE